MIKREQIKTIILYGVFICYIVFLIKLLFLSRISLLEMFNSQRTLNRSINVIPFYSIKEYILGGSARVAVMISILGRISASSGSNTAPPVIKSYSRCLNTSNSSDSAALEKIRDQHETDEKYHRPYTDFTRSFPHHYPPRYI